MTIPIDRPLLVSILKTCVGKVAYELGEKPKLTLLPKNVKRSDCSGWIRYLLAVVTHGKFRLKTLGSFLQRAEIKAAGFTRCDYHDCAKMDSILRVAFIPPAADKHGHIWLCINGQTIECWYGHGVGRRPWNTPVLLHGVAATYVLSDVLP